MAPKTTKEGGPPTHQQTPGAPEATPPDLLAESFLDDIRHALTDIHSSSNVVLNIPIWGWTGDGKTCALLTAVHFADAVQHPLSFALVTNKDELFDLERKVPEYGALNLAATATATTERFRALSEQFIDKNEWPPGTDEPSSYVLAIRGVTSTLGYALFPDIKGGSFRELDAIARQILRTAHAGVLLVNPELYEKPTTDGKRYRDEILACLHHFADEQVPVCIMITKSDLRQEANSATDSTHSKLAVIVGSFTGLNSLLCRVSVVGLDKRLVEGKPPPVTERKPEHLVRAWIWVATQGLRRPGDWIRQRLPPTSFSANDNDSNSKKLGTVLELRQMAELSSSPGPLLCPSGDDYRLATFTFVTNVGALFEGTPSGHDRETPEFRPVGTIPDWDPQIDSYALYSEGNYYVGTSVKSNYMWTGPKGAALTKTGFPVEMSSWTPMTGRRIVGIDATGRIHSLRLEKSKWVAIDYVANFIAPSAFLTCAFDESGGHVVVFNGTAVEAITVSADGMFGQRLSVETKAKFDSNRTVTSRLGHCLAINKSGQATLSGGVQPVDLGPTKGDARRPVALALKSSVLALTTPDLRLVCLVSTAEGWSRSSPAYSPVLNAGPESMLWSGDGRLLVVTFADRKWSVFRPFGYA